MAQNHIPIMMTIPDFFTALLSEKDGDQQQLSIKKLSINELPQNDVLIKVHYSSLNYKDALSAKGLNHVTRNYPHIPGIDAAGEVVHDKSDSFMTGENVVVTGNDLGTNTFGGFGAYICVPKEWIVPLPESLTVKDAMKYGTAGFTAMYGIERLKREGINPDSGTILVTGATGGVGSLAVFFLAELGYKVIASTRKTHAREYLTQLGATEIITSDDIMDVSNSPLLSRKWAGAIETVGGPLLDAVLRQTKDKGAVACCGNILGKELQTNVYPFILRGIALLGIDSAFCERTLREKIWTMIASMNSSKLPNGFEHTIQLRDLEQEIDKILDGNQMGRVVIHHDA